MAVVLQDRAAFETLQFGSFNPNLRRLGDRHALARGDMHALPNVYINLGVACISVSLPGKCLYMSVAFAVRVIDNPSLFLLTLCSSPNSLAYRHDSLLGLNHVASCSKNFRLSK